MNIYKAAGISLFVLMATITTEGQIKKSNRVAVKTIAAKMPAEPGFAGLVAISNITDIDPDQPAYNAVNLLIDSYGIPITFANKTFKPKSNLTRGEFAVHFSAALQSVKSFVDSLKLDTSLINTYDKHASYITEVSQVKDLKASSVYYPAVKSLLEDWGIAAMFTKNKLLKPGLPITAGEVTDIFKVTMGFEDIWAPKPASSVLKRESFANLLAEAIGQIRAKALLLPKPVPDKVSDTLYIKVPYEPTKKL